jgi:hypothetical protein
MIRYGDDMKAYHGKDNVCINVEWGFNDRVASYVFTTSASKENDDWIAVEFDDTDCDNNAKLDPGTGATHEGESTISSARIYLCRDV